VLLCIAIYHIMRDVHTTANERNMIRMLHVAVWCSVLLFVAVGDWKAMLMPLLDAATEQRNMIPVCYHSSFLVCIRVFVYLCAGCACAHMWYGVNCTHAYCNQILVCMREL